LVTGLARLPGSWPGRWPPAAWARTGSSGAAC